MRENSNIETRAKHPTRENKSQCQKFKIRNRQPMLPSTLCMKFKVLPQSIYLFWSFENLNFVFVSNFVLRASNL